MLGWLNGPEPFPEIYDHARKITSGVPTGPVHSPEGWSVIQVEDRRRWPLPFAEVEAKITTEMQNLKFSATKDILLDELRQKYEIHKNVEQLDQLWAEG